MVIPEVEKRRIRLCIDGKKSSNAVMREHSMVLRLGGGGGGGGGGGRPRFVEPEYFSIS